MEDGQKAYRVRHSKIMTERLDELSDLIATAQKIYKTTEELFKKFASIQMNAILLDIYLEQVFPKTKKQNQKNLQPPRWLHIKDLFESHQHLQQQRVKGSLWAAYNAITQFEDYKKIRDDEEDESRLDRAWFGTSAETKLKSLQAAQKLSKAA